MNQQVNQPKSTAYDDEIDLFEIFQDIWREKLLVVIIGFITTLLAVVYALIATPVFQTSSILKTAQLKDLDELNNTGVLQLTEKEALNRVVSSLESYDLRLNFFKENQNLFAGFIKEGISLEKSFEAFNKSSLKIVKPDPKKLDSFNQYIGLELQYGNKINGPEVVNGLVKFAIDYEKDRLKEDFLTVVENKLNKLHRDLSVMRAGYASDKEIQIAKLLEKDSLKKLQLEDELEAIRFTLKQQRENKITKLDEAIGIAQSLGIKKPTTPSSFNENAKQSFSGNVIKTEVNNQEIPLYFLGTDALKAEKDILLARENDDFVSGRIVEIKKELKLLENNRQIQILKQRENDDLFLAELSKLLEKIHRLENLNIDFNKLNLVKIDQLALDSNNKIKPKKSLIVAVGFVLGGLLGIFAALITSAVRKRRQAV